MANLLTIVAAGACMAWFWLLLFRNGFWRADQLLHENGGQTTAGPPVVVIVPARNEADVIDRTIASLTRQNYRGDLMVLVVDDHSEDGTAQRARSVADERSLVVLPAASLEPGWTGKLWAMQCGLDEALRRYPDVEFILFADADIEHAPDCLQRLVMHAERYRKDLVSLMARLHCNDGWERLLIPAFVFFFQKLYPFSAVNDDRLDVAAAAGGCMLVRRQALERAGGLAEIRDALIDDCALAAAIKKIDGRLWLGLAGDLCRSVRPYRSLSGIWNMVARTAFTQLNHSWSALALTVTGMVAIYLAGPLILLSLPLHDVALASSLGLLSWILMTCALLPTLRHYRQPLILGPMLPVAGMLYTMMTIDSAWRFFTRRGGQWKGRTYFK